MPRNLVICLDGTGNRFSHRPTNIIRILRSLENDPSGTLSYYDQGVGTFGLKETTFEWEKLPSRVCGLAFGWGLRQTVAGAYHFLCREWEPGDCVYIFGFSRGAYGARALAALIHAIGLVPAHETHLFEYGWAMLLARDSTSKPDFKLQARFRSTFGRKIGIQFLGLFDTVKSVGWVYDPLSIPYTASNPDVASVRHAVSIDERRCFFRQNLWSPSPSSTTLKEVWFAGVHSDVGGGYPPEEAHLALIAYRWMLSEAISCGLKVDSRAIRSQARAHAGVVADPCAPMHDSLTRYWNLAEWTPRMIWDEDTKRRQLKMGSMPPLGRPHARLIKPGVLLHRSVEQRLACVPLYSPTNLPSQVVFVDDDPASAAYF